MRTARIAGRCPLHWDQSPFYALVYAAARCQECPMAREIDLKNLDLTKIIRPGDASVWGQSAGEPLSLVEKLVEQRKQIGHARVFCAQSYTKTLRPEHADALEIPSYCAIGTRRDLAQRELVHRAQWLARS